MSNQTEIITLEFQVTPVVGGNLDHIDVYCEGTGLAERRTFERGRVAVNQRHDPYSLAAKEWFINHPRPWKVGDTVPKNTSIGRHWTAAPIRTAAEAEAACHEGRNYGVLPVTVSGEGMFREDRVILWIES